jgi:hypothetical protein
MSHQIDRLVLALTAIALTGCRSSTDADTVLVGPGFEEAQLIELNPNVSWIEPDGHPMGGLSIISGGAQAIRLFGQSGELGEIRRPARAPPARPTASLEIRLLHERVVEVWFTPYVDGFLVEDGTLAGLVEQLRRIGFAEVEGDTLQEASRLASEANTLGNEIGSSEAISIGAVELRHPDGTGIKIVIQAQPGTATFVDRLEIAHPKFARDR